MRFSFIGLAIAFCISSNSYAQWVDIGPPSGSNLSTVYFINANNAVCGGPDEMYYTTNGGQSWTSTGTLGMNDVDFVNGNGFGAGTSGISVKQSSNYGQTWSEITPPAIGGMNTIFAVHATAIFWGGSSGQIWSSSNSGLTFTQTECGTTGVNDLHFTSSTTGYAVDFAGDIWQTINGALSWSIVYDGFDALYGISFSDANTGYAVGIKGTVLRTTNGGVNWTKLSSSVSTSLYCIEFYDSKTGLIGGSNGTLLVTQDGGANWQYENSGSIEELYDINFKAKKAYVAGSNGILLVNDQIVGLEETKSNKDVLEYYQVDGRIRIRWNGSENTHLQLINLEGKIIDSFQLSPYSDSWQSEMLNTGMYLIYAQNHIAKVIVP